MIHHHISLAPRIRLPLLHVYNNTNSNNPPHKSSLGYFTLLLFINIPHPPTQRRHLPLLHWYSLGCCSLSKWRRRDYVSGSYLFKQKDSLSQKRQAGNRQLVNIHISITDLEYTSSSLLNLLIVTPIWKWEAPTHHPPKESRDCLNLQNLFFVGHNHEHEAIWTPTSNPISNKRRANRTNSTHFHIPSTSHTLLLLLLLLPPS